MFAKRLAMTRQEQKQFVLDLTASIAQSIVSNISTGAVPETWDGRQLRLYISDRMRDGCDGERYATRTDIEDYNNTLLVNNL